MSGPVQLQPLQHNLWVLLLQLCQYPLPLLNPCCGLQHQGHRDMKARPQHICSNFCRAPCPTHWLAQEGWS